MNDPTPAERDVLAARLAGSIPTEPELTGLAARAGSGARRTRRVRRAGVAVVAAVAVATVIVVPHFIGSHHVTSAARPSGRCVPEPKLDHRDFRQGAAAWVRFCPTRSIPDAARPVTPRDALTSGVAALVASWEAQTRHLDAYPMCGTEQPPTYYLQVGFTDGTVSQIQLLCLAVLEPSSQYIPSSPSEMYDALVAAMGRQNDARFPAYHPPGPPRGCPPTLAHPARMNLDGSSADQLGHQGPLLDLTATDSLVCRYDHGRLAETRRHQNPERLLLASGDRWQPAGRNTRKNLSHEPMYLRPLGSYLVSLSDKTGTWRTFTITGHFGRIHLYRGTGVVTRLGYAYADLFRDVGAHPR